jgi:hypothetical protein
MSTNVNGKTKNQARYEDLQSSLPMKRLVDRMASVRTVDVRWPSEAYAKQPISDKP